MYRKGSNFLVCYVDDCLIIGDENITAERDRILDIFEGRKIEKKRTPDGAEEFTFLGLKITYHKIRGELTITLEDLVEKVLKKFGMEGCKQVGTPMVNQLENSGAENLDNFHYRALVGSLMFFVVTCRPDLAFSVKELSRFLENPRSSSISAGKRVLQYLQGTRKEALRFTRVENYEPGKINTHIKSYADSDFAGEKPGRKSTSGMCIVLNNTPIFWKSITQRIVSLSTAESEYISLAQLVKEAKYLKLMNEDLFKSKEQIEMLIKDPYDCYCDNQAAIKMSQQSFNTNRTKHVDVRVAFIKHAITSGIIRLFYVSTDMNVADLFTKPLSRGRLKQLIS